MPAPRRSVSIRRATPDDAPAVDALVRTIIRETYPDIVAEHGEPEEDPSRWRNGHVAEADGSIVGVGLATDDVISDLWVGRGWRGQGVGAALLEALETQIRVAGFESARLRCVAANVRARAFYHRAGWVEVRTYAHERNGRAMVDFAKVL